jgi:hypothetical protein
MPTSTRPDSQSGSWIGWARGPKKYRAAAIDTKIKPIEKRTCSRIGAA